MDRTERDHLRTQRQPTYISGPDDDAEHIIRTLRRTVGRNGFSYTVSVDLDQLPPTG